MVYYPALESVRTGDILIFGGTEITQVIIALLEGDITACNHVSIAVRVDKLSGEIIYGDDVIIRDSRENLIMTFESSTGDEYCHLMKKVRSGTRLVVLDDILQKWYTQCYCVPIEVSRVPEFYIKTQQFFEMMKGLAYEPSPISLTGTLARADFEPKQSSKICSEIAIEYLQYIGVAPKSIVPASVLPIDFDKTRSDYLKNVKLGDPVLIFTRVDNKELHKSIIVMSIYGILTFGLVMNADIY